MVATNAGVALSAADVQPNDADANDADATSDANDANATSNAYADAHAAAMARHADA